MTLILGIETSCDETAAAVVADGQRILSNVVASQIDLHRRYGGVFPEVASRQHVLAINPVIREAMAAASVGWDDLDALAVTQGPGLAGSLLVGVNAAKGIALSTGLPLVGVNHLEGHVYSNWLQPQATGQPSLSSSFVPHPSSFPVLVLIVSGGHTELVLMTDHGRYRRLGGTLDDAAGEAFDKVARLLGLPYPGGPAIQRAATGGDGAAFDLPIALANRPEHRYNFSFSGLKTAVLRLVEAQQAELGDEGWPAGYADLAMQGPDEQGPAQVISNIAASFQAAAARALVEKTIQAAGDFGATHICVCGGVAANRELRRQLEEATSSAAGAAISLSIPPIWLCTDNAAMIAGAGHFRFQAGLLTGWDLDVSARLALTSWEP